MSQVIPNPKAPKESTDYIYGQRLEKYEDRINFFLNEKVDIDKTNVKDEDKETVDGLESLVQRFCSYGGPMLPLIDENGDIAGTEASGRGKRFIDFLIQAAKDAVAFLLNIINNRIARLDIRVARLTIDRKRMGIRTGDIKYPHATRRMLMPQIVSTNPNWVPQTLDNVKSFYKDTVSAYKTMSESLGKEPTEGKDLYTLINDIVSKVKSQLHLKTSGDLLVGPLLPSLRQLHVQQPSETDPSKIDIYFALSDVQVKIPSETFESSSNLLDSMIKQIDDLIKEIRSNQSSVASMTRNFEKAVRAFENKKDGKLTPVEREYYNWLIRFNKRLMNITLQYVLGQLDAACDFTQTGIAK